jgi:hypothetical protein
MKHSDHWIVTRWHDCYVNYAKGKTSDLTGQSSF